METARELADLLKSLGVQHSLEYYLKPLFDRLSVSGIGIIPGTIPDQVRLRLARRYTKKGKVVFFEKTPVEDLEEFKDYVYFLASEIYIRGEKSGVEGYEEVGVLYFELNKPSPRLKRRFEPWKVYKGEVCVGKHCEEVKWFISVPTYHRYSYLILCHPEDLERRVPYEHGERTIYVINNLISKYLLGTKREVKMTTLYRKVLAPVFSY